MVDEISSTPYAHSIFPRSIRIAVTGKRRDDDVETIARVPSMGAGIRQQGDDLEHFCEGARPSMNEGQGDGTWSLALLANEMKREPSDIGAKMAELIQLSFLEPPIELRLP